jgi:hypothetical protein
MNLLSFWYKMSCPDTVQFDWATATLTDVTAGTTQTVLPKICTTNAWTEVTAPVTASHTYTLTLTSHDDDFAGDPSFTLFDDVTLSATAASAIVNGGFETGTFTPWTPSGASESIVTTAHTGRFAAEMGSRTATNGDSSITQTFTALTGESTVAFFYEMTCPDTVQFDWATATLTDDTSGTTRTILPKTCTTNSWTRVVANITPGHNYTLTLTSHDDDFAADPSFTLFDDVSTQ